MGSKALFFTKMDRIEIAHRLATWVHLATNKVKDDPIFSFISAWIAFNYFYTTFSVSLHQHGFERWIVDNNLERGDRSQWRFLVRHEQFEDFFKKFRQNKVFEEQIKLPIKCMLTEGEVPNERMNGNYHWNDLSNEQIFSVLYQIRNNLFHGHKDTAKDHRDQELCVKACNFMVPLVTDLIVCVFPEMQNTYGKPSWE